MKLNFGDDEGHIFSSRIYLVQSLLILATLVYCLWGFEASLGCGCLTWDICHSCLVLHKLSIKDQTESVVSKYILPVALHALKIQPHPYNKFLTVTWLVYTYSLGHVKLKWRAGDATAILAIFVVRPSGRSLWIGVHLLKLWSHLKSNYKKFRNWTNTRNCYLYKFPILISIFSLIGIGVLL